MKNTLENKSKFFALYWGQEQILSYNGSLFDINYKTFDNVVNRVFTDKQKDTFLQLTPLSQIADEHAIDIGYSSGLSATTTFIDSIWRDTYQADYLRSKGYALPWMGLSVEKQIEYGWVKLTS